MSINRRIPLCLRLLTVLYIPDPCLILPSFRIHPRSVSIGFHYSASSVLERLKPFNFRTPIDPQHDDADPVEIMSYRMQVIAMETAKWILAIPLRDKNAFLDAAKGKVDAWKAPNEKGNRSMFSGGLVLDPVSTLVSILKEAKIEAKDLLYFAWGEICKVATEPTETAKQGACGYGLLAKSGIRAKKNQTAPPLIALEAALMREDPPSVVQVDWR